MGGKQGPKRKKKKEKENRVFVSGAGLDYGGVCMYIPVLLRTTAEYSYGLLLLNLDLGADFQCRVAAFS